MSSNTLRRFKKLENIGWYRMAVRDCLNFPYNSLVPDHHGPYNENNYTGIKIQQGRKE